MELKTLKDLGSPIERRNCVLTIDELKAEAVKWVKEIRKDKTIGIDPNLNYTKKGDPIGTCLYGTEERKIINKEKIEWIKHFFNLTEEDLE